LGFIGLSMPPHSESATPSPLGIDDNSHSTRHSMPSAHIGRTRLSLLQRYMRKFKYPVNPVRLYY